eukprot:218082_1
MEPIPSASPVPTMLDKSNLNCSEIGKFNLSPIKSVNESRVPVIPDKSLNLDTSLNLRHDSSVLNISHCSVLKYHNRTGPICEEEWCTPQQNGRPMAKTISIGHKGKGFEQPLKFHVPSNYSLHPAKSPVAILNLTFEQFDTIFDNIYDIFGSIYEFFAMELSNHQREYLNRSVLFPLESIIESDHEEQKANAIITKCKTLSCKIHVIKYYLMLAGFVIAVITSFIQITIRPSSERSLLHVCCMLWFTRFTLTLWQQRKCIISSYTSYIRQNNNKQTPSKFNWLEIHLNRISSHRSVSTHFNKQFLSYAFIFCAFFLLASSCILCVIVLSNAMNLMHMPIVSEVFLFSTNRTVYALWIWFEFVLTMSLMMFLLPSFILSCVIVTTRFNHWKEVLDHSNELQFSQIRSYIFHGRHLLRNMNEQWSFYLTITIFTTIPQILLQLYTLVLTERSTSAVNQLFGWCWFLVVFAECSITCYYGATIHKSFAALSKSVVDLGSRTMIQGDEQYVQSDTSNSNRKNLNTSSQTRDAYETQTTYNSDFCCDNEDEDDSQLRINTKLHHAQQPFFPCSTSTRSMLKVNTGTATVPQLSINLLLLLVSSMNSIDGISVGGIFTLNFGVIAKFLSALFTFGILFIELTRGE